MERGAFLSLRVMNDFSTAALDLELLFKASSSLRGHSHGLEAKLPRR